MKSWKSILYIIFLILCVTYIVSYFQENYERVSKGVVMEVYTLLLALTVHLLFVFLGSMSWKWVVRFIKKTELTIFESYIHISLVGVGKYLPGKVWGMLARAAYLKNNRLSNSQIVMATLYEQVMSLHAGAILAATLFAVLYPSVISNIVLIATMLTIIVNGVFQRIMLGTIKKIMLFRKRSGDIEEEMAPVGAFSYSYMVFMYLVLWVLSGSIAAILGSLVVSKPLLADGYLAIVFANVIGIVSGFIAFFLPGGIGVRESVSGAILSGSFNMQDAFAIVVLYRLWTVLHDMVSAGVIAIYEYRKGLLTR